MPRETLGLLVGFVGVAIFGGTLPFTRIAVEALDPWFVTAGRASLSGLLAGAVLIVLRRRVPDAKTLRTIAWASLFIVGGFPALTALAMTSVEASHGGVVLGILPLATAAISAWMTGERPSARFWAAAVAGAALVAGFALRDGGGRFEAGDLMLAGAVACAAIGYNLSGRLAETMSGWEVISWILVVALPVTIPLTLWLAPENPAAVPERCWIAFAYVTLMSQYVGFFAWNAGLALGGVTRVSQVQLLQTFVTLIIAAGLNGERVDALTWAVAVLVVASWWSAGGAASAVWNPSPGRERGRGRVLRSGLAEELPFVCAVGHPQRLLEDKLTNLHSSPKTNRKRAVVIHFKLNRALKPVWMIGAVT